MLARFETFGSTGQDGQGFKELGRMAAETNNNLRQHHHQQQQQQKKFGHHQHHPDPHQSFRSLLAPGHMPYAKMDIYADALTDEQLEEVVFSCFVQRQRTRTAESVARATAEAAAEVAAAGGSVASAA
ncbi:hypothetical protein F4778DRAFT_739074 [Xylariomycetidae sp. FL2044]|nr:hypothetical protein F4778DRAFT_739074 [Xylariomycetidae sp. FL2044]